jgi:hypothetical protein
MAEWWLVKVVHGGHAACRGQDSQGSADPPEPHDERITDRAGAGAEGAETYLCPTG